jgi:hypothetical protein
LRIAGQDGSQDIFSRKDRDKNGSLSEEEENGGTPAGYSGRIEWKNITCLLETRIVKPAEETAL